MSPQPLWLLSAPPWSRSWRTNMGMERLGSAWGRVSNSTSEHWAGPLQQPSAATARTRDGRFAPSGRAAHASRLDVWAGKLSPPIREDVVDPDDLEDLGDLGGEGDEANPFDYASRLAAWRRSVDRDDATLGRGRQGWPALDDHRSESGTVGDLAHRIRTLGGQEELARGGNRSRLDDCAWPFVEADPTPARGKLSLDLPACSGGLAPRRPACLSCGSPCVERESWLCRRCQDAENAARELSVKWGCLSCRDRRAGKNAASAASEADDPIHAFARKELEAEQVAGSVDELGTNRPETGFAEREGAAWRRLFRLLALLSIVLGIAATVYGFHRGSMSSSEEGSHVRQ